jgi:hypothetical protein
VIARRAGLAVACAALAGCASAPIVPPHDPGSPTGGVGLHLWYAQPATGQYQLFEVDADGSFRYGGGMEAFNRRTDWSGRLTDAEARAFRETVDRAGWLTAQDPARRDGESPLAECRLYAGGKTRAFEIRGPDPAVKGLVDSLQAIANQRFERFLQRLPEAGTQVR